MIKIENLTHRYNGKDEDALTGVNLRVSKGENLVIIGSSGSGKSTLLKSISQLITPTHGRIVINDKNILDKSSKKERGAVGMIFQNFNLIENETVLQNILNGRLRYHNFLDTLLKNFSKEDYEVINENIGLVGLKGYESEKVKNISGGQKQRVAIARALSQNPEVLLADEPVSSLDPKLMKGIMDLLKDICTKKSLTLITSLHFLELAKTYGSRIVGIKEGKVVFDGSPEELTEEAIIKIYGATGF